MSKIEIPAGLQSRWCELGENVLEKVPAILKELWGMRKVMVVADTNTWAAAGERVQALLQAAGMPVAEPKIFPGAPMLEPDYRHVQELVGILHGYVPVAVGSGVINDLVKCASTQVENDGYLVVATACSVDGYTSYGAALQVDGYKKTVPCAAPLAVLADAGILATAPAKMTASGYGDMLAKVVSGADWHIAATLGISPYNETAWEMTQTKLREWVGDPEGVAAVRPAALASLFEGLAATGFAMQLMHDSRPASGAEHLVSHILEMDGVMVNGEHPSHGFKVGIGTLVTCAMMHRLFAMSAAEAKACCAKAPLVSPEQRLQEVRSLLEGTPILAQVCQVATEKLLDQPGLEKRKYDIQKNWNKMKKLVLGQIFPLEETRRRLLVVGCPVHPAEIGVDKPALRRAILGAQMIRNRYTIFDLAYEMGLLPQLTEEVLQDLFD